MLTGYQCEVVAYQHNGEIVCRECAVDATSSVTVDKAERGLTTSHDLSPLIRYSLDEYTSENAWEYASQEYEEGTAEFDKAVEDYPNESCGSCGKELG